ncbi:MAG: calcium-binding protein, partial [Phenylobacterium sp.]
MTAYTFETITDAQAAAFQAGDTLTFTNPTLTAQSVEVRFNPQTGGGGFPPAPVVPANITLIVGTTTKVFSTALAGMGGVTGQINLPDGTMLYLGTTGADSRAGSALNDALYGNDGDDSLAGLDGNDIIQGNIGNDTLSGGAGADSLYGGKGDDSVMGDAGVNWMHG